MARLHAHRIASGKGSLISERISLWPKSPKKKVPNHSPEHYPPKEKMLRRVIWQLFFGDLNQSEKILDIKPLSTTFQDIFLFF